MHKPRNKWREWTYDIKYSSVRRMLKRKSNKAERKYWKDYVRREIDAEDWFEWDVGDWFEEDFTE